MKNIITILLLINFSTRAYTQNKTIGMMTGASAFNCKSISLNYEIGMNSRNYLGIFAESFFYSNRNKPLTLHSDETHYYAGLYYKPQLNSSRNFSHYFLFGAAVGTHGKRLLYYPFAGFEQNFYIGNKTIFLMGEELKYLVPLKNKWQPFINTGLKFSIR